MMRRSPATVSMKAMTWSRDSHGLFDYESRHVAKQNLRTCAAGRLVRNGNDIQMLADSAPEPQSESSRTLARLNYADGNFYVAQGDRQGAGQSSPPEKVWLVVRSLRGSNGTKGYCLQEGDIVKLGRVKLRVKELCGPITTSGGRRSGSMETDTAAATQSPPGAAPVSRLTRASVTSRASVASNMSGPAAGDASDDDDEYFLADDQLDGALAADPSQAVLPPHAVEPPAEPAPVAPSEPEDPNAALACRICLCDTPEPNNPLISPCRCKGTMKLVHLQCLRSWVEGRLNLNTSGGGVASTFFWRTLDCELCKVPYPNHVDVDGQQIELFEIPKPQAPYIVLESLSRDRSNTNRGIHVISLADRPVVRLGRGHDSDVRVSDISVSRCHATIRYVRDGFYLEDNISKFGTLVQVKRPVRLDTSTTMAIQVGRTVISFAMRRPWNFLPACLRPVMAPGPDAHNPPSSTS